MPLERQHALRDGSQVLTNHSHLSPSTTPRPRRQRNNKTSLKKARPKKRGMATMMEMKTEMKMRTMKMRKKSKIPLTKCAKSVRRPRHVTSTFTIIKSVWRESPKNKKKKATKKSTTRKIAWRSSSTCNIVSTTVWLRICSTN